MKSTRVMVFALVAGFLSACVPEALHPLSEEAAATPDPSLTGDWEMRKDDERVILHIMPRDNGWMEAISLARKADGDGSGDWTIFRFIPAQIGKHRFMSVKFHAQGDDGDVSSSNWFLTRYDVTNQGSLRIWGLTPQATEAAIKGGLKGEVKQGRYVNDIKITAQTSELAGYIAKTNPESLFSAELGTFTRQKNGGANSASLDLPAEQLVQMARAKVSAEAYDEAVTLWRQAIAALKTQTPIDEWKFSAAHAELAISLANLDRYEEAAQAYKVLVEIYEKKLGRNHARVGAEYLQYGGLLRKAGRTKEADEIEAQGHEIYASAPREAPPPMIAPPPQPDTENAIGLATMKEDGTLILNLRAETGSTHGDGQIVYPPNHKDYKKVLRHLGSIKPGEEKLVKPW